MAQAGKQIKQHGEKLRDFEAPLVWVKVTGKPQGLGGPSYGTKYDLSKRCPRCGTGSPQVSPLFVRPSDAPRRSNVWHTLDSEMLLAPELMSGDRLPEFGPVAVRVDGSVRRGRIDARGLPRLDLTGPVAMRGVSLISFPLSSVLRTERDSACPGRDEGAVGCTPRSSH